MSVYYFEEIFFQSCINYLDDVNIEIALKNIVCLSWIGLKTAGLKKSDMPNMEICCQRLIEQQ